YTYTPQKGLFTSICNRTQPLDKAIVDLKALGQGKILDPAFNLSMLTSTPRSQSAVSSPLATPTPAAASLITQTGESLMGENISQSLTRLNVAGSGSVTVTVEGGDEASLRTFLKRYLGTSFPGMPDHTVAVQIGVLPANLPFSFTLPGQIQVIGSIS